MPLSGRSCWATSGSTTRATRRPHRPRAPSPRSTATPASSATGAIRSSSWPSSRPTSRSRTCSSTASCRPTEQFDKWKHDITYHTFIHENVRKRFMDGFHYDAHPMGMLVSAVAALSTFYSEAKDIFDSEVLDKQIVRLIAKMPTLAACAYRFSIGMPFVWPDNSKGFAENFLKMMFEPWDHVPWRDPKLAKALDLLFILHADHELNCGTATMRMVGSSHADPVHRAPRPPPPRSTGPATAAPTSRSSACSPRSARSTTSRTSSRASRRARAASRASATGCTRTSIRGRTSSSRPPTRCSRSPARTRCSTSP